MRFLFAVLTILFVSCNTVSVEQKLSGKWLYQSITKNDSAFLPVVKGDYMLLDSNGNFEYKLTEAGKFEKGTWQFVEPDTLSLSYFLNDSVHVISKVRKFNLEVVSQYVLIFSENGVRFTYKR